MGAPRHVPVLPISKSNTYRSPDVVPNSWLTGRPGDLDSEQPRGGPMGYQGPDQGYALRLCRVFRDQIRVSERENIADVERGCVQIALKRASLFGRAPVVHDLEIAYRIWGFLADEVDVGLIEERERRFEGVSEAHHYADARVLVETVRDEVLMMSPGEIKDRHAADWASLLELL